MSGEDDLEGGKRSYHRHSHKQIHYLEKSFKKWSCPNDKQCEEISIHIGLETKQVKIWFQNKRARVKAMDVVSQEDDLGNKQQSGEDNLSNKQSEEIKFESKKRLYHRYSQEQIRYLEESFKKCPCPDENQRREISNIIGIEPGKVKYWFQNKRARVKAKTTLNVVAPSVRKFSTYVSPLLPPSPPPISECATSILDENNVYESHQQQQSSSTDHHKIDKNIETTRMLETTVIAITELFELLEENEPLWIKSATYGSNILDHRIYDKKFLNIGISSDRTTTTTTGSGGGGGGARTESSKESVVVPKPPVQLMETFSNDTTGGGGGEGEREREGKGRAGRESSKESAIVPMPPAQLMEMFSDSEKWMNFFPTIVVESQKIKTIDIENLAGSLNLIYAKFHTLSPLVVPREYIFLRYCRQISSSIWVVLDTSYNNLQDASSASSWKFPSGCEIQKMPDEKSSMVTWIEHVKVDESLFTDVLFEDVIGNCETFGAKRWLVNLQWMCEKFAFYDTPLTVTLGRLERDERTRKTLMNLSHNMVKNFCEILSPPKTTEVGYSNEDMMFRDFQISVHENTGTNHPHGTMLCVCTSLWLPIFYKHLFAFFIDVKARSQWDVIREKRLSRDTECIATGAHPGNCINWLKPSVMEGSAETILQESCLDSLGGLVIYTPIHAELIKDAINGVDISMTAILPSGFVISGDGRHRYHSSKGSILNIVFQILVAEIPSSTELGSGDAMDYVRALMDATITKIKANTTHLIGIPP